MAKRKKITSLDVAREAGVSQSTVSMVLNHCENSSFTPETVAKVLDAAERLGYHSDRRYRTGQGRTIMVVCPSLDNPYYPMLLEGIQQAALTNGYHMLICTTLTMEPVEDHFLAYWENMQLAGIIYTFLPDYPEKLRAISESMPVVVIGDKDDSFAADAVELDSIKCGMIIAEHLIHLGHERIAFISTPMSSRKLARLRRLEGAQRKFDEYGLTDGIVVKAQPESMNRELPNTFTQYSAGYELTKDLLEKGDEGITAFVGLNDMVALGVMDALLDNRLRIPQDYSVIGCDNNLFARLRRISLTTVEHYILARGRESFNILLRKIEKASISASGYELVPSSIMRVEYEPKLIQRSSTGPNPKHKKRQR